MNWTKFGKALLVTGKIAWKAARVAADTGLVQGKPGDAIRVARAIEDEARKARGAR